MAVANSVVPLEAKQREAVVAALNTINANMIALGLIVQVAHWNVKGPSAHSLHLLFGDTYGAIQKCVDKIAERAKGLGGLAIGMCGQIRNAVVKDIKPEMTDGIALCGALVGQINAALDVLYEQNETIETAGDAVTSNMLSDVAGKIEHWGGLINDHVSR